MHTCMPGPVLLSVTVCFMLASPNLPLSVAMFSASALFNIHSGVFVGVASGLADGGRHASNWFDIIEFG